MTIDDPKSCTAPWTATLTQPLIRDGEWLDDGCLENEKSWAHVEIRGRAMGSGTLPLA